MAVKKKAVKKTKNNPIIAPSILSADFGDLAAEIKAVDKAGADWIHIDVMDGRFVPNITIGPMFVEVAKKAAPKKLADVHLMIVEPEKYIDQFVAAGADIITIHAEATTHLHRAVQQIREAGNKVKPRRKIKAAVSLNPATSLAGLDYVLEDLDMVLLMSVNPGFGGQKFIPACIEKIKDLKWLIEETGKNIDIQVDGGVKVGNIAEIAGAGANVFVAGSEIFGKKDYKKIIKELKANARV